MKTPKDYRCLTCGAEVGSPCKRPSGHTIPFGDYHAGRKEMFSFFNSPGCGSDSRSKEAIDAAERKASPTALVRENRLGSQEALF